MDITQKYDGSHSVARDFASQYGVSVLSARQTYVSGEQGKDLYAEGILSTEDGVVRYIERHGESAGISYDLRDLRA